MKNNPIQEQLTERTILNLSKLSRPFKRTFMSPMGLCLYILKKRFSSYLSFFFTVFQFKKGCFSVQKLIKADLQREKFVSKTLLPVLVASLRRFVPFLGQIIGVFADFIIKYNIWLIKSNIGFIKHNSFSPDKCSH